MGKVLTILIVLLWPLGAWGTNYYVSNANSVGNDSNDGTDTSAPWLTIKKVNTSTFNPGDQILFNKGDIWYEELIVPSSGSLGNPITFGAYGTGSNPVISGLGNNGKPLSGFTVYSHNVWRLALTTQPYGLIIDTLSGADALTPLPPVASLHAVTGTGNWFWASNVLYVYSTGSPDGTVLAPMRPHVVELNGQSYITLNSLTISGGNSPASPVWNNSAVDAFYSNYIHITNCKITQSYGAGVFFVDSSHDVIDSNLLAYIYGAGIAFGLGSGESTQNQVSDNTLHDIFGAAFQTGSGVAGHQLSYFSIYGNTSYNNSSGLYPGHMDYSNIYNNSLYNNTKPLGENYGIGISSSNYNNFFNNIIHDNYNVGIDLYGDNSTLYGPSNGNAFYNNIIYNHNSSYGACTGISMGGEAGGVNNNTVSYNIFFNNIDNIAAGAPIGASHDSNNRIINNVIYGAHRYGLNLVPWWGASYHNAGVILENNIFYNNSSTDVNATTITGNFSASHNIYYRPSGGAIMSYNNTNYTASNISSFDLGAITANPLFTNGSNSNTLTTDFMLQPGSSAIGAGTPIPNMLSDFFGNPVKNPPSIGVYEPPVLQPPSGLHLGSTPAP